MRRLELSPEGGNATRVAVLPRPAGNDVVKRHQPARADERRVVGEVLLHAVVRMVAVDEQEVEISTVEEAADPPTGARFVGVPHHDSTR